MAALPRPRSAALPPLAADLPRNRLGLARWLTAPDHPLTARVQVNRMWQHFFGRGLVGTSENFGSQGDLPSHPELLDWLARDFISHGWDMKRLCRQIVLSATYSQDSKVSAELRQKDPANILLARGPAKRLSGEELRDQALSLSGLLYPQIGDPPVKPYLPESAAWKVLNAFLPVYKQDAAPGIYRRSLYSFWRRTAPPPGNEADFAEDRALGDGDDLAGVVRIDPHVRRAIGNGEERGAGIVLLEDRLARLVEAGIGIEHEFAQLQRRHAVQDGDIGAQQFQPVGHAALAGQAGELGF